MPQPIIDDNIGLAECLAELRRMPDLTPEQQAAKVPILLSQMPHLYDFTTGRRFTFDELVEKAKRFAVEHQQLTLGGFGLTESERLQRATASVEERFAAPEFKIVLAVGQEILAKITDDMIFSALKLILRDVLDKLESYQGADEENMLALLKLQMFTTPDTDDSDEYTRKVLETYQSLPALDISAIRGEIDTATDLASLNRLYRNHVKRLREIQDTIEKQLVQALMVAVKRNDREAINYALQFVPADSIWTVPSCIPREYLGDDNVSPLHLAVAISPQMVEFLLEKGAKADCVTETGMTPLMLAAAAGHYETIGILHRAAPGVIDAQNMFFNTALHVAINNDREMAALRLLSFGASLKIADYDGNTPLVCAAGKPCNRVVSEMLLNPSVHDDLVPALFAAVKGEQNFNLVMIALRIRDRLNVETYNGYTPLMLAVMQKNLEIAEILFSLGADINHANEKGETALLIAARENNDDMVKFLRDSGANVDGAIIPALAKGRTNEALLLASSDCQENFAELVRGREENLVAALFNAIENGRTADALLYASKVHDLDAASQDGYTPIMCAVQYGDLELARGLIPLGADVTHPNKEGVTALIIAAREGRDSFVELLLEHGANPEHADASGRVALRYARSSRAATGALKLRLYNETSPCTYLGVLGQEAVEAVGNVYRGVRRMNRL